MKSCPSCGSVCHDQARFCPSCGASVVAARARRTDPFVGMTLSDKYLVKRLIGEGGMGRVYEAEQVQLEKPVAVKILHQHLVGDEHSVARFVSEAREASRLNHPNIVSVLEFGETPAGVLYLVMEYLRGRPLSDVIAQEYPLSFPRVVSIFRQVLLAVEEAHRLGVIHRDLKPDNIFIEQLAEGRERVKVIDFGIAKRYDVETQGLTSPGMVCGTPEYMSPEQVHGDPLDPRSDVYALGVILYEMLVGTPPFQSKSAAEVMVMQAEDDPLSPSAIAPEAGIPASMDAIVLWALAKDREDRIESAEAFRRLLDSWLLVTVRGGKTEAAEGRTCPSCHRVNDGSGARCRFCGFELPEAGAGEGERFLEETLGRDKLRAIRESQKIDVDLDLGALAEAQASTASLARAPGVEIQQYLPLVGRAFELETVLRWVEQGGSYRIVGEPGIGKSRLMDEVASRAQERGYHVLRISPRDDPLWPAPQFVVRAICAFLLGVSPDDVVRPEDLESAGRRVGVDEAELPGLGVLFGVTQPVSRALSPEAEAREAVAALRSLAEHRAQKGPVALLLEDMDLGDAPSRRAVWALQAASRGDRILVASSWAEAPPDTNGVLETLVLRPLEREQAVRLAMLKQQGAELDPETLSLVDVAGGNPFFLDQLVRLSHEGGLPGKLRRRIELLDARLDALPLHLRETLQIVAVHQGRVSLEWLGVLSGKAAAVVDTEVSSLESMGLLVCGTDWVAPSHSLVEQAVLAAMPAEVRRRIHAQVLDLLPDTQRAVGARALHAQGAEDPLRACEALDRAGATAWVGHDPERAVRYYHQALHCSRLLWGRSDLAMEAQTRATVEVSRRLAAVLIAQGEHGTAGAVLGEAESMVSPSQPVLLAALQLDRAGLLIAKGNIATAGEVLTQALRKSLEADQDADWIQCRILTQLAEIEVRRGQYDRALELLSEAYGIAAELDDAGHGEAWQVQLALGELHRGLGDTTAAESFLEQAQTTASAAGWTLGVLAAQRALARLREQTREPERAALHLAEAVRLARDLGDRGLAASLLLELGTAQQKASRPAQAAASFQEAARLAERVGQQATLALARERLDQALGR